MARRQEFRMDREQGSGIGRLVLTKQQQYSLLRWTLYGLMCLAALLMQDVLLYRVDLLGAGTDLLPCVIFIIAMQLDVQRASLFSLITGILYYCSGSAPGVHVIPVLTCMSVFLVVFRQGYLQQGFLAVLLSTAVGMLTYELSVFVVGLITGDIIFGSFVNLMLTGVWSLLAVPVCHPMASAINKIGGDLWRE